MNEQSSTSTYCPYCNELLTESSADHIFNDFLGGKQTVPACIKCNNEFGGHFEGQTAKSSLHKIMITLINWGVPLKVKDVPEWKEAVESEGLKFDLSVEKGEVKLKLSKPLKKIGEKGELESITFDKLSDAQKALANSQRKGKALKGKIEHYKLEIPPPSPFEYLIDSNLERTALKMCVATATLLPDYEPNETLLARLLLDDLERRTEGYVTVVAEDYPELEKLHQPLDHLVYVERQNSKVIGVVQFFGILQVYCFLGRSDMTAGIAPAAMLGTLDPITGEEKFKSLEKPLNLQAPDDPYHYLDLLYLLQRNWNKKLEAAAKSRGAKTEIKLAGELSTNNSFDPKTRFKRMNF